MWLIAAFGVIVVIAVFISIPPHETELTKYCRETFELSGICPEDTCMISGIGYDRGEGAGAGGEGVSFSRMCIPKPCFVFDAESCPLERCQVMTNCKGEEVCYDQFTADPPACGGISYYGQDVACCEGLIKKCGGILNDGSCDMASGGYNGGYNNFPWCLPCGNGVCEEPYENRCSCPEDCG